VATSQKRAPRGRASAAARGARAEERVAKDLRAKGYGDVRRVDAKPSPDIITGAGPGGYRKAVEVKSTKLRTKTKKARAPRPRQREALCDYGPKSGSGRFGKPLIAHVTGRWPFQRIEYETVSCGCGARQTGGKSRQTKG
jgi:Holliday junction resolvase